MAKTRAQRKAERRKRQAQQSRETQRDRGDQARAQQRTQVPESADVLEAEIAEAGVDLEDLKRGRPAAVEEVADRAQEAPVEEPVPKAPAPSRADAGRLPEAEAPAAAPGPLARRRAEREQRRRAKESARRREAAAEPQERTRGPVVGFLLSSWAELKRVQWPNRETLIQASAVTLVFIAVAAAYLGALDATFNFLVKRIL